MGCWLAAVWVSVSVLSNIPRGTESQGEWGKLHREPGVFFITGERTTSPCCWPATTATAETSDLQAAGLGAGMDGASSLRNPAYTSVLVAGLADAVGIGVDQLRH